MTTMDKIANKSPIQQYLVFCTNGNTNLESETLGMKKLEYCDTLNELEWKDLLWYEEVICYCVLLSIFYLTHIIYE